MQLEMLSCICYFFCKYSCTTIFFKIIYLFYFAVEVIGNQQCGFCILLLSGQLTGVRSARWWSQAGARALLACQTWPWQRRARWVSCSILTCGSAILHKWAVQSAFSPAFCKVKSLEVSTLEADSPPYPSCVCGKDVILGRMRLCIEVSALKGHPGVPIKPGVCICVCHM